ncbi:MAG: glycosyltransferase family 9 protein [Candidatus Omnitrophica bacterium]|nr:glycosyltransferase family 9 protein [Candidatus Omnitrophota bacterium]
MSDGGIGDLLMMSSLAKALSRQYEVDLIVNDAGRAQIFRTQSIYKNVYYVNYAGVEHFSRIKSRFQATVTIFCFYPWEYMRFALRNHSVGINCAIFSWTAVFGGAFLAALDIPVIVGFARDDGFVTSIQHYSVSGYSPLGRSVYLRLLDAVGYKLPYSKDLYFEIDATSRGETSEVIKNYIGTSPERKIAVIHPGGKIHINSRRWPAQYYREIARYLTAKNYSVFISGYGKGDEEACEVVSRELKGAYNICDKLSFNQLAALIDEAEICVCSDTAIAHLVVATKCKLRIVIYGPTNSVTLEDSNENTITVASELTCAPCKASTIIYKIDEPCPRKDALECLREITPERVIKLIEEYSARHHA